MTPSPISSPNQPTRYQAYLVRLWRENEATAWRVAVVSVSTGEQWLFKALGEALAFIEQKAGEPKRGGGSNHVVTQK
ncbi:MAG: hypothetical protein KDD89_11885, partial [Anaerolineales bacterium]|nr:hypothetical protein [Anaerolineales bacterium]